MNNQIAAFLYDVSVWALPIILAITLHEAAHGFAAKLLGDPTPKAEGRLSINPLRHIDPFGTVILPGLLLAFTGLVFGYAKPVRIDYRNLKKPKRDMAFIAAAGPAINFLMAFAAAFLLKTLVKTLVNVGDEGSFSQWLGENLINSTIINVLLGTFNLIPLPPLDGGRVLVGLLPGRLAVPFAQIEPYGMGIIFLLVFIIPFISTQIGHPFNPLGRFILPLVNMILTTIMTVMGHG